MRCSVKTVSRTGAKRAMTVFKRDLTVSRPSWLRPERSAGPVKPSRPASRPGRLSSTRPAGARPRRPSGVDTFVAQIIATRRRSQTYSESSDQPRALHRPTRSPKAQESSDTCWRRLTAASQPRVRSPAPGAPVARRNLARHGRPTWQPASHYRGACLRTRQRCISPMRLQVFRFLGSKRAASCRSTGQTRRCNSIDRCQSLQRQADRPAPG